MVLCSAFSSILTVLLLRATDTSSFSVRFDPSMVTSTNLPRESGTMRIWEIRLAVHLCNLFFKNWLSFLITTSKVLGLIDPPDACFVDPVGQSCNADILPRYLGPDP